MKRNQIDLIDKEESFLTKKFKSYKERNDEVIQERNEAFQNVQNINKNFRKSIANDAKTSCLGRSFGKDVRWVVVIARSAGATVALFIGIATCWALWFYIFKARCASINGNICNYPYGYCTEQNVCNCLSPLVSGVFCEVSACNNGCQNGGVCSPYMQSEFVVDVCRKINPTPENSLQFFPNGWENPPCVEYIAGLSYKALVLKQPLTDEEGGTWPSCLCKAPWTGPSCENNIAPQDAALRICSDNGNKTIDYYENDTIGLGAQCLFPFTLLDYSLNENMTTFITNTYPNLLFEQFCGTLISNNRSFYVLSDESCIGCYCDEFSSGRACELSPCTLDEFGQACNGNGAPNVGIGLEYNTSVKKHKRCSPICADGYELCNVLNGTEMQGTCLKNGCNVKEKPCPIDRPYRCRDLQCIDGLVGNQGIGEQGFNEYVAKRNLTLDGTQLVFYELEISSPLVGMIFSEDDGIVVEYLDERFNQSFNVTKRNLIFNPLPIYVYVVKEEYLQVPSYLKGDITLIHLNGEKTLISLLDESEVTLLNSTDVNNGDTFFVLNATNLVENIAVLSDLSGVTNLENCFINSAQCTFAWNGTNFLPPLPNNYVSLQKYTVATKYSILFGPSLAFNYPYGVLDEKINDADLTPSAFIFINNATNITLHYYLQEDLVRPDICSPYQDATIYFNPNNNQSYYNKLWYSEYYRQSSNFEAGVDYLCYFSFASNSWERGLYVGNGTVKNVFKADLLERFDAAKKISKTEHDTIGLVECPSYLVFYNKKCIYPTVQLLERETNCYCPNSYREPCHCLDGTILDNSDNHLLASCNLYANGLYFPIRWIYTGGDQRNETARFNGLVFFENNITEVYYGNFSNLTLTATSNWTIGGYFPLGNLINVNRTASTNRATAYYTNASTNLFWRARSSDRNVYLNLSSPSLLITSLIVHLRNNTIVIGNTTIIIPVYVLTSSGERINITEINAELIINLDYPAKWASLKAPYPFSVFEFSAFSNQQCNSSSSSLYPITNITVWGIEANTVNDTLVLQQTNNSCIYNETCTLFNYTDVGFLNYSFTVNNYIFKSSHLRVNKDTCFLNYFCENGSCQNEPCETRYNCDGNGCFQPDARIPFYKCACRIGWNGLDCETEYCKAITWDLTIFDEERPDPHSFCACGGPPPIKLKPSPSALLRKRNIGFAEYLSLNRLGLQRSNANDVRDIYIRSDFAPYGVAITRVAQTGSLRFLTTCPYARKGPSGQYLQLEDDVEERNTSTGDVIKWRSYYDYDLRRNVTAIWSNEASFDDFPFRTPNGRCVESKSYAINEDICNGHGKCRADGTCLCTREWTTFVFTKEITQGKSLPYYWDGRYNLSDPTIWGLRNTNWRDFSGEWCTAKNCDVVDCSKDAIMGCFTGTPPDFKDSQVMCKDKKSCAANVADCLTGNRTELLECSGNGKAKKKDYRDEWYCECGFTETERNGFGGPTCSLYTCPEKLNREYSMYNKKTRSPYFNKHGERMRGKWLGYCGVNIGPSPDDFGDWQTCCPNIPLELCNFVPCVIKGRTECKLTETCIPLGGTPKVYPCNDKGVPRADGTCECEHNENDGTGYVPDPDIGEEDNCYAKIQCPMNEFTGTPCGKVEPCDDPGNWVNPPLIPFFNQQIDILLFLLKFSFSNESVINEISNRIQMQQQKLEAYEAIAIATREAIRSVRSGIYVDNPNDTNYTFPIGMLPYTLEESYVILPYDKPFETPFLLPYNGYPILKDDWVTALEYSELINGTDYLQFPLSFNFTIPNRIYAIRVHARAFNAANQTVRFLVNGREICPLVIVDSVEWDWAEQYCDPIYVDFDFETLEDYQVKCVLNKGPQEICDEYKKENCPGKYLSANGLHIRPRGCFSECCILALSGFSDELLQNVTIIADNNTAIITVDQVQFYGFYNQTVRPVPAKLFTEKNNCSDTPDYRYAQEFLGDDKSFFYFGEQWNSTMANVKLQELGAWLATTISSVSLDDYDAGLAQACFNGAGANGKCLIGLRDSNASQSPSNISEFFENTCTAWGCYFEARNDLDMYAARNMSIYDTQWANSSQRTWAYTLDAIDLIRKGLNYFVLSPTDPRKDSSSADTYRDTYYQYPWRDYLNIWLDNNVPFQENYLWDKFTTLSQTTDYNPKIRLVLSDQVRTSPIYDNTKANILNNGATARMIVFESNKAIYNRLGVINVNNPATYGGMANELWNAFACTWSSASNAHRDPRGWCGTYLKDAFPFEFFGIDIINYLDRITTSTCIVFIGGCIGPSTNKLGFQGKPIKGNAKSIYITGVEADPTFDGTIFNGNTFNYITLILGVRLSSGSLYNYNVTLPRGSIHTCINDSTLMTLQVLPGPTYLPFRQYKVATKGEGSDKGKNFLKRDATMGYLRRPYEGMRVFIEKMMEIKETEILVGDIYRLRFGDAKFTYGNISVFNITNALTVKEPSNYYGEAYGVFTYDNVINNFIDTAVFGRLIRPCYQCEIKKRSIWLWLLHTYTRQGGFPKQATVTKDSGIVIFSVPGIGSIRLDEMNVTTSLWRWYTRQSVVNTLNDYLEPQGFAKDWCTTVNASTGKFDPISCDVELASVGMYDYGKYVALDGRIGQYCGCSNRRRGFAQPGVTCIDSFPLANATKYPFEHYILSLYEAGTLNVLLEGSDPYNYDGAREFFFRNDKPIGFAIPEAWDLWRDSFSNCPGSSIAANPYDCIDYSIRTHFPHNCGSQISKRTGEITHICARDISYCDPDATYPLTELRYYPNMLYPLENPSPKNLLCAYSIRVSSYVVLDKYGGATPAALNVLSSNDFGSLRLLMSAGNTFVYNTGKPTYVFEGNLTYYGVFEFSEGATGNFTIWVSPLSPTYLYPTTKINLYSSNITNETQEYLFSYLITQNATYQTIGFDFRLDEEAIVTISNVLISNNNTLAKCQEGFLGQKRYEPPPFIKSEAPKNRCVYSKSDTEFYKKNINVGQCFCDHMFGGAGCKCPAIRNVPCGGAYGTCVGNQCQCQDMGSLFYQKLIVFATTDYLKVYVQNTVYNELAFVLLSNSSVIKSLITAETLALTAATTLPSFVNGDEMDEFLALLPSYPVFLDLVISDGEMEWQERGVPFDWSSKTLLYGEPVLNQGNWTSEIIGSLNFDNLVYNTSNVLNDGSLIYFTNISTFTTTLSESRIVYIFSFNASCTTANCALLNDVTTANTFICSAGVVSFNVYNISEFQVYEVGTISTYI